MGLWCLTCESIVVREQLTEEFLNVTNDKIPQAKLVFMLFSKAFVKNCWPEICKMKNFKSAIYDNKPLIIQYFSYKCISWWSALLLGESGVHGENHFPVASH
jgi:hypothetical protein